MIFSNINVSTEELPTMESVVFKPLEKDYLKVSGITYLISTLIVLLIGSTLFFFIKNWQIPVAIIASIVVFLLLTIMGWILTILSFKHSGYALRERDILFRRGWLVRKTRAVPLKRVQHVSVQSGPIERKFGLASISIYTAGSEEADFTIRGITNTTAHQIEEWISKQLGSGVN